MTDWHEYPTNFSNGLTNVSGDSVTGVSDLFGAYPASVVGTEYGLGFVVIIWLVIFSLSNASGARKAFMVASFITGILSFFLWRINMIDSWIVMLLAVLTAIGAIGSKDEQL